MKKYTLQPSQMPFDLDITLSCGQVFQWVRHEEIWTGIVKNSIITIRQNGKTLEYDGCKETDLINYFNLNFEIEKVTESIRNSIAQTTGTIPDLLFETALSVAQGLRIIRQDPWECLVSFICSQNSNIPAITKRINLLSQQYGNSLQDGWFGIPDPLSLTQAPVDKIRGCSTGYRASYLTDTASYISENPDFLSGLSVLEMKDARILLLNLSGVGPKVADCVLLFAYNYYQAVPVDVWIRKIITKGYPDLIFQAGSRKEPSYDQIADYCRNYFGYYAGYAQQLLFAARNSLITKHNT